MKKITVSGVEYTVDHHLEDYTLKKAKSDNIDWIGHNGKDRLFVQFNSGRCYFYKVPPEFIEEIKDEEKLMSVVHNLRKSVKDFEYDCKFYKMVYEDF